MPYMGDQNWWNHRFHQREWKLMKPDPRLESDFFLFQKEGCVLDVACGDGRNAIFLAENGFLVDGIDFSESALKRLSFFAEKAGVTIHTAVVDLDGSNPFQGLRMYDSIIINHYRLHSELYADLTCHLKENGILWVNGFYDIPQDNPFVTEQDLLNDGDFSGLSHCALEEKLLYQNGSHTCVRYLWRKVKMKKIIVIGCPGAGKSTFARRLRDQTGLPLYYLDMIWHKPDKTNISCQEFDRKLDEIVKKDEWIIDGNYGRTLEMRLRECDTVFLLDLPVSLCLAGAESRIGTQREDMPWKEETMDEEFRDWIVNFSRDEMPHVYELLNKYRDKNIVVFKSREEVNHYII